MFVILLRLLYFTRYVFGRRVDVSVPPRGAMFRETSGLMVGLVFPFSPLRRPGHKVDRPLCLAINREAKLTLNPGHYDQHEASRYYIVYIRSYILYTIYFMLYIIYHVICYILYIILISHRIECGRSTAKTRRLHPSNEVPTPFLPGKSTSKLTALLQYLDDCYGICSHDPCSYLPVAPPCCTSPSLLMLLLVTP